MSDFAVHRPATLSEALHLLARAEVRPLAGGTDLIPQWREGRKSAAAFVDVKSLRELNALEFRADGSATIGAAIPCVELYARPELAKCFPALDDACRLIGGWQIQQRASLGGNLCNASPSADSVPALIVHDAVALVSDAKGMREIPAEEFSVAPGRNALAPGELLRALRLPSPSHGPAPAPHEGSAYLRFIPRAEMDIAVVGAGVRFRLDEKGAIRAVRIALGAVGPTALRARGAEEFLEGQSPSAELFKAAGEKAREAAKPIDDQRASADFRRHLVGVLVTRALSVSAQRLGIFTTKGTKDTKDTKS